MANLSDEQQKVADDLLSLLNQEYKPTGMPYFLETVGGYAGTGKTFLIGEFRKMLRKQFPHLSILFVTFTGKASGVLKNKLEEQHAIFPNDYIGTIHRLIYKPKTRWDKVLKTFVIIGWETVEDLDGGDLIIIDEASMVSEEIFRDLSKYKKPIIAFGDHGQLPPIGDNFNLMATPKHTLKEIQRQSLDSPIIALSHFIRQNGYIPGNQMFSPEVFKFSWSNKICKKIWEEKLVFDENLIILCAFNTTRANLNDKIRERLNFRNRKPYPGERIVCLANNQDSKIMNGQIGTVIWVMPEDLNLYRITYQMDGSQDVYESMVSSKCFGEVQYTMYDKSPKIKEQIAYIRTRKFSSIDFFDYGYSISVHKSQGSEWPKVVVFEQRTKHWDDNYYARWLYTAITRAKEKLFIISDYWG